MPEDRPEDRPENRSLITMLRPRYWPVHLFAIAATVFAIGMGTWQYGSWQDKRDREALDLTSAPAVALTDAIGPDDPFPADQLGRPVEVVGDWIPESTVFVEDRRTRDGRAGFWVVTPVAITGLDSALLVVRGWVADLADAPPPPTGPTDLVGWLQPPEGARISDTDAGDDVLPQLRIADAIQHVDTDLFGGYAILDHARDASNGADKGDNTVNNTGSAAGNTGGEGLEQAEIPEPASAGGTTGLRNILYAAEWWIFGFFALFVWWRWLRDELRPPEGEDEPQTQPQPGPDPRPDPVPQPRPDPVPEKGTVGTGT